MPSKKKSKKAAPKPAKKSRQRSVKAKTKSKTSKKPAKKKATRKPVASKPSVRRRKKAPSVSTEKELKRELRDRKLSGSGVVSSRRSEDFEGISQAEQADSESVDELVEEGNVFEAGAVAGVQEADDEDEEEVHTHEFPEDDVPEEYTDKD
jgi:hypothetical protein